MYRNYFETLLKFIGCQHYACFLFMYGGACPAPGGVAMLTPVPSSPLLYKKAAGDT